MTIVSFPNGARLDRPRRDARIDDRAGDTYWRRLREPEALVALDLADVKRIPRIAPVIDVGCGDGAFVRRCLRAGIDAVGVEAFAEPARLAGERGAVAVQGAGQQLPFATASIDVVRSKEVLEHVAEPLRMTREIRRVLRPGGLFLCYVPTQWSTLYPFPANFWDDYTHVRPFSRVGLGRLLEDAGFDRISITGYTPPLRSWQRPVSAVASRVAPFLWRALAVRP
jgi:SAM-dependent methyltransferase